MAAPSNLMLIIIASISIHSYFQPIFALSSTKFAVPKRLEGNNESALDFLEPLRKKYNPIDLGIGAPDYTPPTFVKDAMTSTVWGNHTFSQYTKRDGEPRFVNAIARFYSKLLNRTLDPQNNINVCIGATQALFATVHSHTSPGDEWIIIEPYYNYFVPTVKSAHGVPRILTMNKNNRNDVSTSKYWTFDRAEMARAFNNKTKGILLNNPHNPTGKVFTLDELEFIASLAKKWDTLVVSDEVYEFMVYDKNKHIRIATLPDMFERTITLSSASKIFASTGYRLGWAYGGAKVLNNLKFIQHQMVFSCPTIIQEAFARVFEKEVLDLGKPNSYLEWFNKESQRKRDYLVKIIRKLGVTVLVPDAGHFILANFTSLKNRVNYDEETGSLKDIRFANWLIKNVQIEGYPLSDFYTLKNKHLGEDGIRLTFIKTFTTLDEVNKHVQEYVSQRQ